MNRSIFALVLLVALPLHAAQLININTADQTTLETLQGIGPAKALAIIEYRNTNGPFLSIEDIIKVSGIGPAIFEDIKAFITVETLPVPAAPEVVAPPEPERAAPPARQATPEVQKPATVADVPQAVSAVESLPPPEEGTTRSAFWTSVAALTVLLASSAVGVWRLQQAGAAKKGETPLTADEFEIRD